MKGFPYFFRDRRALLTLLMLSPGILAFLGLFLYPLLITVWTSLSPEDKSGGLTLANYINFLTSSDGLQTIGFTFFLALSATILSILLSLPLILILRERIRGNRFFRLLILAPLMIPGLISALGLYLFWDKWGWFNLFLTHFFPLVDEPIRFNFTIHGLILFYMWLFFPYTCLTSLSAIESIDRSVEEAAAVSGANPWQVFRYILFPLTLPGIIAGSVITFILSFGALSIPLVLAGDYRSYIMAARIYTHAAVFRKWEAACAMAVVMAAIQIVFLSIYMRISRREVAR
jgi:ABC-type spermidine/putrescine transport system permease subunit I